MNLLVDKKFTVGKKDNKTHIRIPFFTAAKPDGFIIRMSYNPNCTLDQDDIEEAIMANPDSVPETWKDKFHEMYKKGDAKLHNLVSISIEHEGEFIGNSHKHQHEQTIYIKDKDSTPGFSNGRLASGEWTAILSVHAVYSKQMQLDFSVESV